MRAANPSLLSANELTLAYGHQVLLAGVTLAVAPGEKWGLSAGMAAARPAC